MFQLLWTEFFLSLQNRRAILYLWCGEFAWGKQSFKALLFTQCLCISGRSPLLKCLKRLCGILFGLVILMKEVSRLFHGLASVVSKLLIVHSFTIYHVISWFIKLFIFSLFELGTLPSLAIFGGLFLQHFGVGLENLSLN